MIRVLTAVCETAVNCGKTKDGVAAGGVRLAEEVANFIRKHVSLDRISFVGHR